VNRPHTKPESHATSGRHPPRYSRCVGVPAGSCTGTGTTPDPATIEPDASGRETGVCSDCNGRFRLGADRLLPNHGPAPRLHAGDASQLGEPADRLLDPR
jgi:hypothetical protein